MVQEKNIVVHRKIEAMKVGLNQMNRPAPVWFRRLRDAIVIFLLPAVGQLVTSLNLTDAVENIWLQALTFIPAFLNAVGVILGDDVKRKSRTYMWLILIVVLAGGCKTAEKAAQRERNYIRELEGRFAGEATPTPPLVVPGGMVVLETQSPCPDFDSGQFKSKDGKLTAQVQCPDKTINLDSLIRNSDVYKSALLGRAKTEAIADSLGTECFNKDLKISSQRGQLQLLYPVVIGGLLIGAIFLFAGSKLSFITKWFK